MFLDRALISPLPIFTFLIIHPSVPIFFDTRESPHAISTGYFHWWVSPIARLVQASIVKPNENLVSQLPERYIQRDDLKYPLLSHLHDDRAGGLPRLPERPSVFISTSGKLF